MAARKKREKSILLRVLLLVLSVYMIYQLGSLQIELISKTKTYKSYQAEAERINLNVDNLSRLLEEGSEAEIIEKAARDRLGYVFPDEQVFIDISGN